MLTLAPPFRSIDCIAGLNLNYRNCEEFRDMQIVRHAKYVGTMIGPNGHLHRWTAPRKKFMCNA